MCLIGVCSAGVYKIHRVRRANVVAVPQEALSRDDLNVAESAQFGYGGYDNGGYGGYGGYGGNGGFGNGGYGGFGNGGYGGFENGGKLMM